MVWGWLQYLHAFYSQFATDKLYIDVLICVFGGTTGWIFGLYVTPSSEGEKEQFSDFGKTFIAFVSGFGLASVKDFMEWSAITKEDVTSDVTIFRLLIFACMFLLGSLFTYISRRHVRGPDDERRDKRASLIVKMEKHLQALKSES